MHAGITTTAISPALWHKHRRRALPAAINHAPGIGSLTRASINSGTTARKNPLPVAQWLYRMNTGEKVKNTLNSMAKVEVPPMYFPRHQAAHIPVIPQRAETVKKPAPTPIPPSN